MLQWPADEGFQFMHEWVSISWDRYNVCTSWKKNPLKKCLTTCLKEHFVAQVKHIFWTLSIRSKLMQTSFTKILLKILPPENAIKNLYTELKGIKLLFSSKSGIFGVFIDVWYKHDLKEGCCMQLAFFSVSRPVWNKFTFDKSKM